MAESPENVRQLDTSDSNLSIIFTPAFLKLADIFKRHGRDLRVAGGAVRDILSGRRPHDVDFATPATPEEMLAMFAAEDVRTLNDNGAAHGTVTARIDDENFEITTLRIDAETDGRHAIVKFTRDWFVDANRRDLTINAMFLTLDGKLVDYFGGEKDLRARRVAFVGDAGSRIKEDYLRILRYFRFYGRVASEPDSHEEDTLRVIRENREGMDQLSGERIWDEMKKILTGNHAGAIVRTMHRVGLMPHCGLSESIVDADVDAFVDVCSRAHPMNPLPMTLLAKLLKCDEDVRRLVDRLKISRAEKTLATFMLHHKDVAEVASDVKTYQDLIVDELKKDPMVKMHVVGERKFVQFEGFILVTFFSRKFSTELLKYKGDPDLVKAIEEWTAPKMPVSGFDLMKAGVEKGKKIQKVLLYLMEMWKKSNFQMTKDELLAAVPACD